MEQVINKKGLFVDYCLLLFIILWSGGSATFGTFGFWPYVMILLACFIAIWRGIKVDKSIWFILGLFAMVTVFQMLKFNGPVSSIASPILGLVAIALIASITRSNISRVFVNIMAVFAIISVVFWLIDMSPDGHTKLLNIAKTLPQLGAENFADVEDSAWNNYNNYTLYFYNVSESGNKFYNWARNSGPFYEPGRFTIVLNIAMAFILFDKKRKMRYAILLALLLANITTFSTTGYLAMFLLFLSFILSRIKHNAVRGMILFVVLAIVADRIFQVSFMSEKISSAFEETDVANSRFGAMIYHWNQIMESPFIGFGNYLERALGETQLSPCGITEMMRRWGIPLFVVCIWLIYRGAKSLFEENRFWGLSFTIIMLLLAYTQTIMSAPLFYMLYFLSRNTNCVNAYGEKV